MVEGQPSPSTLLWVTFVQVSKNDGQLYSGSPLVCIGLKPWLQRLHREAQWDAIFKPPIGKRSLQFDVLPLKVVGCLWFPFQAPTNSGFTLWVCVEKRVTPQNGWHAFWFPFAYLTGAFSPRQQRALLVLQAALRPRCLRARASRRLRGRWMSM